MTARPRCLLVYPRHQSGNIFNFEHFNGLYPGRPAVMPSLGLLTIGAKLLMHWEVRLVDENVRPLTDDDLAWADLVGLSGMHQHRARIIEVVERAQRMGKMTMLGGPSVSICPEFYPQPDVLHVGEMGDATDEMVAWLLQADRRPDSQVVFRTDQRTPIGELPLPAYDLIDVNQYMSMPLQFSVGCPFSCEFCDIPILYGRVARIKSGQRVIEEMELLYDRGFVGTIALVDDNLYANRKALRAMLREVIAWQEANSYPFPFSAEATVNLAQDTETLDLLRRARVTYMFLGIETPDAETLKQISKRQNIRHPILESIRTIQANGMEVMMGIIFGFDTDTEQTGETVRAFIEEANVPTIVFNLLSALPKTPLWDRLEREGRLIDDADAAVQSEHLLGCLSSNVDFKLGRTQTVEMLRETVAAAYSPEAVFKRLLWNAENVYGNQIQGIPPTRTWGERGYLIGFTLGTLRRVVAKAGLKSSYKAVFWRYLAALIRLRLQGRIHSILEVMLRTVPFGVHFVEWGRDLTEDRRDVDLSVLEQPRLSAASK